MQIITIESLNHFEYAFTYEQIERIWNVGDYSSLGPGVNGDTRSKGAMAPLYVDTYGYFFNG